MREVVLPRNCGKGSKNDRHLPPPRSGAGPQRDHANLFDPRCNPQTRGTGAPRRLSPRTPPPYPRTAPCSRQRVERRREPREQKRVRSAVRRGRLRFLEKFVGLESRNRQQHGDVGDEARHGPRCALPPEHGRSSSVSPDEQSAREREGGKKGGGLAICTGCRSSRGSAAKSEWRPLRALERNRRVAEDVPGCRPRGEWRGFPREGGD